ncbi:MAG TPA: DnaA/Hda family protein [Candidatus Hydrogenedentes bacterium]|mgnify:CR=1 FL=1|nr:DnaA/Hda family protein [Candidatus Hydrogenedentota bacterium]
MKGMTFNSFIEDENNQAAVAICRRVAALDKTLKSPIVLLADRGAGKTHLLWSIVNYYREHQTRVGVALISASDFPRKVRRLVEDPAPLQKNRAAVLLVDELELFREDAGELEAVVGVFLDHGHTVVLASQVHPSALSALSGRFRALLSGGTIVGFQAAQGSQSFSSLPEFAVNQIAGLKQTVESLTKERDLLLARMDALRADTGTVPSEDAARPGGDEEDELERVIQERDAARQALQASEEELLELRHQVNSLQADLDSARQGLDALDAVLSHSREYSRAVSGRARDTLSFLCETLFDAADAPAESRQRVQALLAQLDAVTPEENQTAPLSRAASAASEVAALLDRAGESECPAEIVEGLRRHVETLIRLEHLVETQDAVRKNGGHPRGKDALGTVSEQIRMAFGDPSDEEDADMTWATPIREDDDAVPPGTPAS